MKKKIKIDFFCVLLKSIHQFCMNVRLCSNPATILALGNIAAKQSQMIKCHGKSLTKSTENSKFYLHIQYMNEVTNKRIKLDAVNMYLR